MEILDGYNVTLIFSLQIASICSSSMLLKVGHFLLD